MGAEVPWVQCDMAQTGEAENSPDEREQAEGESPQSDHGKPEQISESDNQCPDAVLRGWISYFRLTEVRGVLEELDGWIKRKLRCLLWRQWKRPGTRTKNLQRAGLSKDRAMISAYNNHGPWWNSGASHMNQAIKNAWFRRLGLISLLEQQRQFQS